jgi:hypothetical protein
LELGCNGITGRLHPSSTIAGDSAAIPWEPLRPARAIPGAPALRLDFLDAPPDDLYFEYTVTPPG